MPQSGFSPRARRRAPLEVEPAAEARGDPEVEDREIVLRRVARGRDLDRARAAERHVDEWPEVEEEVWDGRPDELRIEIEREERVTDGLVTGDVALVKSASLVVTE